MKPIDLLTVATQLMSTDKSAAVTLVGSQDEHSWKPLEMASEAEVVKEISLLFLTMGKEQSGLQKVEFAELQT